jgi:hypothetical protein
MELTHDEVGAFASTYGKIEEKCKHVFELLTELEYNVWHTMFFKFLNVSIECLGFGTDGIYSITFPSYLLFSTDEEIIKYKRKKVVNSELITTQITDFTLERKGRNGKE